MSRYIGPSCRQCRREGTKLFLKGTKCLTEKCPVERRPYPAGQHGQSGGGRPRKTSEYAKQLREKQKVKRMYGLTERQFRNTFETASLEPGVKGTNLLVALETRLDNIVYRMGFAASRKAGRQLIRHGHVEVNGRSVDVPSFHVVPGHEVRVTESSRELVSVKAAQEQASRGAPVSWLSVDADKAAGRLVERPTREAIPVNAQEQLIVELYSK
ncbi:MAG: 30S ribosomal protein S4 [Bacillota bacterium]|jgi:small subunit ribosomal protein S4